MQDVRYKLDVSDLFRAVIFSVLTAGPNQIQLCPHINPLKLFEFSGFEDFCGYFGTQALKTLFENRTVRHKF